MLVEKILSEVDTIQNELISARQLDHIRECEKTCGAAVWGTGKAGEYAVDFCRRNGVQPVCAVDSFEHEEGSCFHGLPLLSAKAFFEKFPDAFVIIACSYGYGIDQLLEERGQRYLVFDTNLLGLQMNPGGMRSYADVLEQEKEKIEAVYAMLADDTSKHVFERLIKYRLSLDLNDLKGLNDQPIYFANDVIPEFHGEVFVDCGAFVGDTLLRFHQAETCTCKTYYALEPAHNTFLDLSARIKTEKISYAVPIEIGTWNQKGVLRFANQNGAANHIADTGAVEIQTDSLDNLFYGENVDFIKMDIEGAEGETLCGARKIICDRTPFMAFSVYHKMEDMWELPLQLRDMNEKYRWYVRHHSPFDDDTVLYAVPED